MERASEVTWADFWNLYNSGTWEPETKANLERFLEPGDLFVDVGAWIGPVSMWARERGARIIAIEPDPVAVPELERLVPEAEIWSVAVGIRLGTAYLTPNPKEGGWMGDSMSRLSDKGTPVTMRTLPDILNGRVPKFVKIDVEGYEMELCPVLMPWLAYHGVPVQVSCHGEIPRGFEDYENVEWPDDPGRDVVAW